MSNWAPPKGSPGRWKDEKSWWAILDLNQWPIHRDYDESSFDARWQAHAALRIGE